MTQKVEYCDDYHSRWLKWRLNRPSAATDDDRLKIIEHWYRRARVLRFIAAIVTFSLYWVFTRTLFGDRKKAIDSLKTRPEKQANQAHSTGPDDLEYDSPPEEDDDTYSPENSTSTDSTSTNSTKSSVGAGSEGRVYQQTQEDGSLVAIKEIPRDDNASTPEEKQQSYHHELAVLTNKGIRHNNIITLLDHYETNSHFVLVMELGVKNLWNWVETAKTQENFQNLLKPMFVGIAVGLRHLHQQGFIHCDLKPENIVLSEDFTPKLIDFGQACTKENFDLKEHRATPLYIAPESIRAQCDELDKDTNIIPENIDIYSFGLTILACLSGTNPYIEYGIGTIFKKKSEGEMPIIKESIPINMQSLIKNCIHSENAKRISSEDLPAKVSASIKY